jgi:hypothetical protein
MEHLTDEQSAWLLAHPHYQPVGKPTPLVQFSHCGTLQPDGTFDRLEAYEARQTKCWTSVRRLCGH